MPKKIRAYCGLLCNDCPAYIALRTDDNDLRTRTAKRWSAPDYSVTPEEVNCDGCKSEGGNLFKHCTICAVRQCSSNKHLENCAYCDKYPCGELEQLFKMLGNDQTRTVLDDIRRTQRILC